MSRTHSPAKQARRSLFFLAILLFTSVYLAVVSRLPFPTRTELQAGFFMANLVVHLLQGLAATVLLLRFAVRWLKSISETEGPAKIAGYASILASSVTLAAGITLVITGNTRPYEYILRTHGWAAVIAAITGAIWLAAKSAGYRVTTTETGSAPLNTQHSTLNTPKLSRSAATLIVISAISGFGLMAFASHLQASEGRIVNATIMPASMEGEGDGPKGAFWPSAIQKVDKGFFPPEYFTDNETCGEKGCHPDIYKQWHSSSHHFASFNNQWYRKSVEYMQEVVGTRPSKWCGGCHDMAISLTEKPGTGKTRFDFPIKDQIYPPEEHKEAHSGIGCAVCHSTVHTKSTMGNGDYILDYPPMHKYMVSANPLLKATTKFLTRLAPDPHRKTFLKPFHREDTAKFCSACHKVHLDIPVNNFRWFRGFNDYDAWQASGVSGQGARSFYYPKTDDGKPDFKKCADCHMKLEKSDDAGNIAGKVHSHRFIAANTALPYVNHDTEQLMLTQKFLKDGALSIDIFALRREKSASQTMDDRRSTIKAGDKSSSIVHRPSPSNKPSSIVHRPSSFQNPQSTIQNAPEGQSASLFGEAATTGNVGGLMAASSGPLNETIVAPINRGAVAVERGKDALIDVVVRTKKVGHAFPGGTFDAFDVWVELQAKDETGKNLFWSGCLEWPNGPIEPSAHQYQAVLVDAHSRLINKRNAWAARARIYARAIPPGAADTIHYRLHIPKDCGKRITLTAKLNYRKFSWWNTQFAFRGRPETGDPNYSRKGFIEGTGVGVQAAFKSKASGPVTADYDDRPMRFDGDLKVVAGKDRATPNLPITAICETTATLEAVDRDPEKATEPRKLDPKIDRERWNDYGIGSMLQGDFARATSAFKKVAEIAPGWPEGYVNIGRVRLQEGDLSESGAMFEKALGIYATVLGSSSSSNSAGVHPSSFILHPSGPPVPPAMAPYLKARTQFFYGTVLKNRGQYDEALKVWQEAARIFPDDRELRNQMGRVHFLFAATDPSHFDRAIEEFQHVLTIDPEDLTAHYNLMLCYKGKGAGFEKREELHRTLYFRFKNDETTTYLQGPYKIAHPYDNNESIQVHEHTTAPPPRTPEMVLGPSVRKEALKPIRKAETPAGRPKG